jgi:hypothetical protein
MNTTPLTFLFAGLISGAIGAVMAARTLWVRGFEPKPSNKRLVFSLLITYGFLFVMGLSMFLFDTSMTHGGEVPNFEAFLPLTGNELYFGLLCTLGLPTITIIMLLISIARIRKIRRDSGLNG